MSTPDTTANAGPMESARVLSSEQVNWTLLVHHKSKAHEAKGTAPIHAVHAAHQALTAMVDQTTKHA